MKDRVLHHAIVRILEPIFDKTFIFDSFSSREEKGTHEAHKRFENFAWRLSRNNTRAVWSLKCDIKKFFDSMDHEMLLTLLAKKVDSKTLILLSKIVESFHVVSGKGLPIGNLTSQLFSNIYLNELDQFIKRRLRVKYYIRYADDFVILSADKEYLEGLLDPIGEYLQETLKLELHPNKIILRKWTQGIDFLGYVIFPFHKILRTKTKTRILKKMRKRTKEFEEGKITGYIHSQSLQSYLGMLKHCRGNTVSKDLEEIGKLK